MLKKIKVIVIDDHDLIREGLNRIISFEEDLEILGEGKNGEETLELVESRKPEVVVLDINMPKKNGLEALKEIKAKDKNIKVIMLTVENDKKTILEAIDIGADGYILKESAGSEIVNAIRLVYKGEKYIDKILINTIFYNIKKDLKYYTKEKEIINLLTKRELSILYEISKGLKNKQIAEQLFLSEKTVKNYITGIFKKIKVEDRVQATIFAIKNDIEEIYKNYNR
jgi:two-component system, NarL family, response regulator DegU